MLSLIQILFLVILQQSFLANITQKDFKVRIFLFIAYYE